MPKIGAATVAEHRARQQAALLDAARTLLLSGGYAALTFQALAEKTGLARPTVYSYFKTRDDVVVALCAADLPTVATTTQLAVADADSPHERLAAFVRAQLGAGHHGRYRLAQALGNAPLSASARERIAVLHRELMPRAEDILTDLGHPDPTLAATLLQGLINAAVAATDAGADRDTAASLTVHIALAGFGTGSRDYRHDG